MKKIFTVICLLWALVSEGKNNLSYNDSTVTPRPILRPKMMLLPNISYTRPQFLLNGSQVALVPANTGIPLTAYTVKAYNGGGGSTRTTAIEMPGGKGKPSLDQNHIFTYIPRIPISDVNLLAESDVADVNKNVQYFDGVGRPLQSIQIQANTLYKDVVQPFVYDEYGRELTKYLPYASATGFAGSFKKDVFPGVIDGNYSVGGLKLFYDAHSGQDYTPTDFPFAETNFEKSPLNRVYEQGFTGADWQALNRWVPTAVREGSQTRSVLINYLYNNALTTYGADGFAVMKWDADTVALPGEGYKRILISRGRYNEGELFITVTKDENWLPADGKAGTVEEYKDKEERVILKRIFNRKPDNGIEVLSTYYVYDYLGNLSYVIPPGALGDVADDYSGLLTVAGALDNYCYQYRYDERNRLIEKKLPGKDWEYLVYNKLDQLVASQDAEQRKRKVWIISRYDKFGRAIMSGTWNNGNVVIGRADLKTQVYASPLWDIRNNAQPHGYELKSYPQVLDTVLTVNYYDNYNIAAFPTLYDRHNSYSAMTKGMLTASKTLVLDGGTNMLWEANYYDDLGRNVLQISQHYKGGVLAEGNYDETLNTYSFTAELLTSTRSHKVNGTEQLNIKTTNEYDHVGRLIKTWQKVNNGNDLLLAKNEYNEVGQLKTKLLHSTTGGEEATQADVVLGAADVVESGQQRTVTASNSITLGPGFEAKAGSTFQASVTGAAFLQTIRYAYNERGWLKQINDPDAITAKEAFGMKLFYNDHLDPLKQQFNGNISGVSWQSKTPAGLGLTQELQSYDYSYDKLNRIKLADYTTAGKVGHFNEALNYDVMGNITALERKASGAVIDQLSYAYANGNLSNRLSSVTDNSGSDAGLANGLSSYTYDDNGSMVADTRKALNIQYNLLNLPRVVKKTTTNETINYIYDATGKKLRKVIVGGTRDYIDGIEYDNDGNLEFFMTPEGRAVKNGAVYSYEYFLKDHLGNTRSVVKQDGSILQTPDYYAFGMELNRNNVTPSPDNRYKYNGKELQNELGLAQYDYGARFYDPVIGRWNVVDRESEKYSRWSPYNYVFNNPIKNIDPKGDTVRLASNSSDQFKNDYATMRADLRKKGLDKLVKRLENSKDIYIISESNENIGTFTANTDGKGHFRSNLRPGGTITWNSSLAIGKEGGAVLSPESIFMHEVDHAASYDTDPFAHLNRQFTPDSQYGNAEERRVITGSEQETSVRLGETFPGIPTRTDHNANGASAYITTGPLSNKGMQIPLEQISLPGVTVRPTRPRTVNPRRDQ